MKPPIDQNFIDDITVYLREHLYDTLLWQIDNTDITPDDDYYNELHTEYMNAVINKLYQDNNELT